MSNVLIESPITVGSAGVAVNSTAVTSGAFVALVGNTVGVAGASSVIAGVSNMGKTFASDNETVAKEKLGYTKKNDLMVVRVAISGGTITSADVNKLYTLSNSVTVDGTTESTSAGQLRLVKFISATLGDFAIL